MVIEKTIGSGGDYADIGTANAAIYSYYPYVYPGPHITDDWVLTIISDFTENTGTNANYFFYDGHSIEIRNPNHYTITVAPGDGGTVKMLRFQARLATINDKMIFNDLIFSIPYINPANAFSFLYFCAGNQFAYVTAIYNNCIFLCNGYAESAAARGSNIIGLEGGASFQWSNAVIFNCKFYNFGTSIGSARIGTSQIVIIENCSSYGSYYGIQQTYTVPVTAQYTIKNTVIAKSISHDYWSTYNDLSNINIINCADSDDSISTSMANTFNCITGIVDSDFISVDKTSSDFLKINNTSNLYGVGTTDISAWNTKDLDGFDRPGSDLLVSIGAYEGVLATKTHTFVFVNGEIKSHTVVDGGTLPTPPNTHEWVIENGLTMEWNISSGGSRPSPSKNHSIEILKGLVQSSETT